MMGGIGNVESLPPHGLVAVEADKRTIALGEDSDGICLVVAQGCQQRGIAVCSSIHLARH